MGRIRGLRFLAIGSSCPERRIVALFARARDKQSPVQRSPRYLTYFP
jgi:hypothetical protein